MTTAQLCDSSYDKLTIEEARCLKQKGVSGFIQCLLALPASGPERPTSRVSSIENAIAAGLDVYGYLLVGAALPGGKYVDMAHEGMPAAIWDLLGFIAVDIETPNVNVQQAIDAFDRLRLYGQETEVLYTSYHAWTNLVFPRNDKRLAQRGVRLWAAEWDGNPQLDTDYDFGGWADADVVIKQYSGGTMQCGQYVDRNVADAAWLESLKGDQPMTDAERKRLEALEAQMAFAGKIFNNIAYKDAIQDRLILEGMKIQGELSEIITAAQAELDDAGATREDIAAALEAVAAKVRGD